MLRNSCGICGTFIASIVLAIIFTTNYSVSLWSLALLSSLAVDWYSDVEHIVCPLISVQSVSDQCADIDNEHFDRMKLMLILLWGSWGFACCVAPCLKRKQAAEDPTMSLATMKLAGKFMGGGRGLDDYRHTASC
eukprot:COSAG05_NODE_794_length_7287_cov_45.558431_5_plen_135_part_00